MLMIRRVFRYALCITWMGFANCDVAHGQTISTIAGGYTIGYSGDNGPAVAAQLNTPWGAAADSVGNVFFVDYSNNVVRKISTGGIITTIAGNGTAGFSGDGGPAIAAQLNEPMSVAVDKNGNLYISDVQNRRVRRVDAATGIITTFAGNGIYGGAGDGGAATNAQLKLPNGVVADNAGNVYIADVSNNVIRVVNAGGVIKTFAGNGGSGYSGDGGPATSAAIHSPWGLAIDRAGNLYIAEFASTCIRKVNTSGVISTCAGRAGLSGYSGDGGPATMASLSGAGYLAVDKNGTLYISESINNRVRKVDGATGIITSMAGIGIPGYNGDGINATEAELYIPRGIAADQQGNVYIADGGNSRIRRINTALSTGTISVNTRISVYPNPVLEHQSLTISTDMREQVKLVLTNVSGEKIEERICSINPHFEMVLDVPAGNYILTIISRAGDMHYPIFVQE